MDILTHILLILREPAITSVAYFFISLLLVFGISGFKHPSSAKNGIHLVTTAVVLGVIWTIFLLQSLILLVLVLVLLTLSLFVGTLWAKKVKMTQMPEMVAILNGLGGLSSAFTALAIFYSTSIHASIEAGEIYLGAFVGVLTFSGSAVAYGKLSGKIPARQWGLPMRHALNIIIILAIVVLGGLFLFTNDPHMREVYLYANIALSAIFGLLLIMAIGGADMPVVIAMLNSYSGIAAALTGFLYQNDLLVIGGALVGSSGAILSYVMCKAMNRPFINVMMGGFGDIASSSGTTTGGEVHSVEAEGAAKLLGDSRSVIIAPGYGMAVAQAQHAVQQLTLKLEAKGIKVRFAIHPVAGRMPGHMNVLLAEAKIPYDQVFAMEEINDEFSDTDCVLVIGANDTVNPDAQENSESPIAGMPVLEVWKANHVIVMKRSMAAGYSGVANPLFHKENTLMLFGDAKSALESVIGHL